MRTIVALLLLGPVLIAAQSIRFVPIEVLPVDIDVPPDGQRQTGVPIVRSGGDQYLCEGNEVLSLAPKGEVKWKQQFHSALNIYDCDVATDGELVAIAFDNVIVYLSADGTPLWSHANQGKAAWSDAIALGNGQAIAIIDQSLYSDHPFSPPFTDDRVLHIKRPTLSEGAADISEIGQVPSGTKLFRSADSVYAITPPINGERRIMQLVF